MQRKIVGVIALGAATLAGLVTGHFWSRAHAQSAASTAGASEAAADAQTRQIALAATAFLQSLTPEQKQSVQFDFMPDKAAGVRATFKPSGHPGLRPGGPRPGAAEPGAHGPPRSGFGKGPPAGGFVGMGPPGGFIGERYGKAVWSNFPVSDVPRPGVKLGGLTAEQRGLALRLLQTALSPTGYRKVQDIMGSDEALHALGQPFVNGRDAYTLAIFGAPGPAAPWMIQFGGHHLALNLVMAGAHGSVEPTLTGAQPSVYTEGGKTIRVLAAENDKAFALLDALDARQRKAAILTYKVDDLVLGPGHDGEMVVPEGIKGTAMTARQQALLMDVISEWAGIISNPYAKSRMAEIKAGLADTWFAWSGPTTHVPGRNGSSYYRIQGPKVFIEFSPQGVGGDPTMHVHTVYRDPTSSYGRAFTAS